MERASIVFTSRHLRRQTLDEIAGDYPTGDLQTTNSEYWSRRQVLQFLGLIGVGLMGSAGKRILDIEHTPSPHLTDEELWKQARQFRKPFSINTHPDFWRTDTPWDDVTVLQEKTKHLETVGMFLSLEDVDFSKKMMELHTFITQTHSRNLQPMINLHMYSRPNGQHPFHNDNQAWFQSTFRRLLKALDIHPFRIDIRFMYEMNIPYAFVYGRWNGLDDEAHERGFRQLAQIAFQECEQSKFARYLAFSPSILHNFAGYLDRPRTSSLIYRAGLGVDGYNLFPGTMQELLSQNASIVQIISRFFDQFYLIWGQRSNQEIFGSALQLLKQHALPEESLHIFEYGTRDTNKERGAQQTRQAMLVCAANGGDGISFFIQNKANEVPEKPFEHDWRLTPTQLEVIAQTAHALNQR